MYKRKRHISVVLAPELAGHFAAASRSTFLAKGEEKKLGHDLQHGTPAQRKAAMDRLVTSHILWAINIAKPYFLYSKLPQEELAQQAMVGLVRACNKYNGSFKFATYAQQWVEEEVKLYAQRFAGVVHTPASATKKQTKIRRKLAEIERGKGVSIEALAAELNMDPADVTMYLGLGSESSLNRPLREDTDGGLEWQDVLVDPNQTEPLVDDEREQLYALLHKALGELDERERHILMARFGINQDEESTLEDLHEVWGVSRERVRQIEVRAKEKLREGPYGDTLRELMPGI